MNGFNRFIGMGPSKTETLPIWSGISFFSRYKNTASSDSRRSLAGESGAPISSRRTRLDWLLVGGATAVFVGFAAIARLPHLAHPVGGTLGR